MEVDDANSDNSQGFPKQHRLLARRQYLDVQKRGRRSSDALVTLIARPNDLAHARLGITVSKRVSKRAVDRNRIKRWIREDFRKSMYKGVGLDLVIIVKPNAVAKGRARLSESVSRHWRRIRKEN